MLPAKTATGRPILPDSHHRDALCDSNQPVADESFSQEIAKSKSPLTWPAMPNPAQDPNRRISFIPVKRSERLDPAVVDKD
jgi:hypothetical protein